MNELLCKIIAYNITVLIREMIEMGADPELLSLAGLKKEVSIKNINGFGK